MTDVFEGFVLGAVATFCVFVLTQQSGDTPECPELQRAPQKAPEFNPPPDCGHLYNVGRSEDWQACMGVALVPPANYHREDF